MLKFKYKKPASFRMMPEKAIFEFIKEQEAKTFSRDEVFGMLSNERIGRFMTIGMKRNYRHENKMGAFSSTNVDFFILKMRNNKFKLIAINLILSWTSFSKAGFPTSGEYELIPNIDISKIDQDKREREWNMEDEWKKHDHKNIDQLEKYIQKRKKRVEREKEEREPDLDLIGCFNEKIKNVENIIGWLRSK